MDRNPGRGSQSSGQQLPPEVHVYNNFTLDPRNPNTSTFIYKAMNNGVELAGRPDWARK
jgi:hypothetical protein